MRRADRRPATAVRAMAVIALLAGIGASPAQVEHAARCYHALATALPLKARLVWFVRRTAKGLGGVEQVP